MELVELVAMLAVVQFLVFGALTGAARRKSGLKAPTMAGDEGFERMYRVQSNTLETLIAFLPSLFLAAIYWPKALVAAIGAVYLIGRFVYCRSYVRDPSSRSIGFLVSIIPTALLCAMALLGISLSLAGLRA